MDIPLAGASLAPRDSPAADNSGYSEPEIEALLVEITRLAAQFARELVKRRGADDIAQDVVLECLTAIRAGRWSRRRAQLPSIVANLVRERAIDSLRSRQRAERREAAFGRELLESSHVWMTPDGELEEHELAEMRERALASLPPACRRAYLLVRDQGMSYEEAAGMLGVSRSGISAFVVKAQRKLRGELANCGIEAQWRRRRSARRRSATTF
jgi:RNA polymerase sigma-70 factor (ECF subfamily)